ncbi:MAG: DNA polymerase III subunit gamma/tau, partial [Selenomonadaceae bacterium]|nr:DNA polymerase III subunit gamma/tau [Selenomonadaceae bacterium]
MAYEALYTRARPKNLAQLVGQDHISNSLARAINQDRLSHAYLLVGTRGTGKTSTARILARAINCDRVYNAKEHKQPLTTGVIPCNECDACRSFKSSPDNIEFDAASNRSVEDVSKLLSTAYLAPLQSRFKTYIIDEVHMLSFEAVNSILKLIEEPPKNVIFFLATTEFNKVPLTIRSRCQILNFKLIPPDIIKEHLIRIAKRLDISIEDSAAAKIARLAKGSMRDSLTYFDQCYSMMGTDSLTVEMVENTLGLVSDSDLDEIIESAISKDRLNLIKNIAKSFKSGLTAGTIAEALITRLRDKVTSLPNGQEKVYELAVYNELISQLRQAVIEMQGSGIPEVIFEAALLKFVSIPLAALPKTAVPVEYEIKPIIQDKNPNPNKLLESVNQIVQPEQPTQNKPINNKIIDFPTNLSNSHLSNNEAAINESVENNEQMEESENINSGEVVNNDDVNGFNDDNYFNSLNDLQDDDFVNLNNDSQDEDYNTDLSSNSDVYDDTDSTNADFNSN